MKKLNMAWVLAALTSVALLVGCQRGADSGNGSAEQAGEASAPDPAATPAPEVLGAARVAAVKFGPAIPEDLASPPAESGGECGIEATEAAPQGSELRLHRSKPERIEGWALDRTAVATSESIYVKLATGGDASYFVKASSVVRPGLGVRLQDESLDRAGFVVDADLSEVPAGNYEVQVAQRVGGRVLLCATGRSARVID